MNQPAKSVARLLLMVTLFATVTLPQERRGSLDLLTILDVSKSMVGGGGTQNIFSRVQQSCREIVGELRDGDSYTLMTFGERVRLYPTVTLHDQTDRQRVSSLIDGLKADENWTYTSAALNTALEEARRLETVFKDHKKILFILTDGINDPPPQASDRGLRLQDVARPYTGKGWYVYQVQYGDSIDRDLASAIQQVGPGGTISDKNAAGGFDRLRPIIQEQQKLRNDWQFETDQISFKLSTIGEAKESVSGVRLPSGVDPSKVRITIDRDGLPDAVTLKGEFLSRGEGKTIFRVLAVAEGQVPNQKYEGKIRFEQARLGNETGSPAFELPYTLETALIPPTWPLWLAGLAAALALVALATWLVRLRRSHLLFGKLDWWHRANPEKKTAYDDLRKFGIKLTIGSERLPVGDAKDLAVLRTQKVEGESLVSVTVSGEHRLYFDGRLVSDDLVLYDGSQFRIDEFEFKYSGATGRRPRK